MPFLPEKHTICRTCLSENGVMIPITNTEKFDQGENIICDVLECCASIQVNMGDKLPMQMCAHCVEELRRAFAFRTLCEKSDATLRDLSTSNLDDEKGTINDMNEDIVIEIGESTIEEDIDLNESNENLSLSLNDVPPSDVDPSDKCVELDGNEEENGSCVIVETVQKPKITLYKCQKCCISYSKLTNYRKHMSQVHNEQLPNDKSLDYICIICNEEFGSQIKLDCHNFIHTGQKPYECKVCSKRYMRDYHLKAHMSTHTGNKPFQCEFCEKFFSDRISLAAHKRVHTSQKYQCSVCDLKLPTKFTLKLHAASHVVEEEKPFKCEFCDRGYMQSYLLKAHMILHMPESSFKCDVCGKIFSDRVQFAKHRRLHTDDKFLCSICGKEFKAMNTLKIHAVVHTGEKPFKCELCGMRFSFNTNLAKHRRIHTGERPHVCHICGKSFIQGGPLRIHIMKHTGEKPLECEICHKGFYYPRDLTIHMRTHTGMRPHECSDCAKCFLTARALKNHKRVHTGERPYICEICGCGFKQTGTLSAHTKLMHKSHK